MSIYVFFEKLSYLLQNICFVGHENINPSKHLNLSGLHLNHLGTPILTVNFFNVLNSLDSEQ